MNCEPPYDVQHVDGDDERRRAILLGEQPVDSFSGVLGRKAVRFRHMSSCPVMPWIR